MKEKVQLYIVKTKEINRDKLIELEKEYSQYL